MIVNKVNQNIFLTWSGVATQRLYELFYTMLSDEGTIFRFIIRVWS